MKNRGMADILVYVLILAFVVVIASVIFVWSTNFSKDAQGNAEASREEVLLCANVGLSIRHACMLDDIVIIMAENKGYSDITGIVIRLFSDSGAESSQIGEVLSPAGISRIEVPSSIGAVKKLEAIPKVGTKMIACKDIISANVLPNC